ncbi:MAG: hypothetical protein P8Y36_09795, partial [Alphaproteobacteria bacterium]
EAYREYVKAGIAFGSRPELTGGGLIRSMGGWSVVKAMRSDGTKEKSDERILGGGEFVSKIIKQANDKIIVLRDSDGDGAADQWTLFAEGFGIVGGAIFTKLCAAQSLA